MTSFQLLGQYRNFGDGFGMGPGMMGYGSGPYGGFLMIIILILSVIGLIFLVKWIISSKKSTGAAKGIEDSAIDILKLRYAKGEITKDQYLEMKKELDS